MNKLNQKKFNYNTYTLHKVIKFASPKKTLNFYKTNKGIIILFEII